MDYAALSAPFAWTFTERIGGTDLTFVTGEQVTSRLNEVLGPTGWTFTVKDHGVLAETDELWVLGRLDAGDTFREQFGGCKIKRSSKTGMPLDFGNDLKGAATDAFKKCAMGFGVGLYLSEKAPPRQQTRPQHAQTASAPKQSAADTPKSKPAEAPICEFCTLNVVDVETDTERWPVDRTVRASAQHYGQILCWACLRERYLKDRAEVKPKEASDGQ